MGEDHRASTTPPHPDQRPPGGAFPAGDQKLPQAPAAASSLGRGRGAQAGGRSARPSSSPSPALSAASPSSRQPATAAPREGRGEAAAEALGNHADTSSGGDCDRRAQRWALLDAARPITSLKRLRDCRRATLTGTGGPVLRTSQGGRAGYAGLATCGSPWACPCCAGKIAGERASELTAVMEAVAASGGVMDFVTLTVRHHKGQRLADVWSAVTAGWSAVTSGEEWMRDKSGQLGWARVIEVTHTPRSGWHVHAHCLIAWKEPVAETHSANVAFRAWKRWDRALRRHGFDSTPVRGFDTRRVVGGDTGLAGYFGKAALELTSTLTKDSRAGRSPFAILRDATEAQAVRVTTPSGVTADATAYVADDLELWREWEQASLRRKQLTWSTRDADLRRFAGLGRERSDEEIAEDDTGGEDTIALAGDTWTAMSRERTQPELLRVTDEGGVQAAARWLEERGLAWSWARPYQREPGRRRATPQTLREARAVLGRPG